MKTHHLWVLGTLLLGIGLLALLGFFKSREGFTVAVSTDIYVTGEAQTISGIDLTGYTFDNLRIGGTFVERANGQTPNTESKFTEVRAVKDISSNVPGLFILAAKDRNFLKMVRVQFKKTSTGAVQASYRSTDLTDTGSKYFEYTYASGSNPMPAILTDTIVREKWYSSQSITNPLLYNHTVTASTSNPGSIGYGIKNLTVELVKVIPDGKTAADMATQNPNTINPATQLIRCPTGYKFFNGPNGDSMCCKGTINPYTHMCEGVEEGKDDQNKLCAFKKNVPDPRKKFSDQTLMDCRKLITIAAQMESTACPTSLPYFAREDDSTAKCCKNPIQLFGDTGFTCSDADLEDTSKYCIAQGTAGTNLKDKKTEKYCSGARMMDTAACPTDVTGEEVFQTVTYTMGKREAEHYDNSELIGEKLPACFRLNEVCLPESAIRYAQAIGAYSEYDPETWEYSCNVWSKKNRGEMVTGLKQGYLTGAIPVAGPAVADTTS